MGKKYNGKKLFEAIIITEEKVGELYRNLASQVEDEKAKKLFLNLANDEDRHKSIYTALLDKLPDNGEVDLSEDEIEYTEALIEANIVDDKNIEKRYSKFDALLLAEKIERDGIMFIYELMSIFPSFAEKELKIILSEEKKHLQAVLDKQFTGQLPSLML